MSHKLCNSLQDFPIPFARFKLCRLSNVVPAPLYIQTLKHSTTTLLLLFSALPLFSSTSYIYNDFEGWEGKEITHFSFSQFIDDSTRILIRYTIWSWCHVAKIHVLKSRRIQPVPHSLSLNKLNQHLKLPFVIHSDDLYCVYSNIC
jgi:hypothetical protein